MRLKIYLTLVTTITLTVAVVVNLLFWQNIFVGRLFGFIYLLFHGYLLGKIILKENDSFIKACLGFFFQLSIIILFGSIIYYFFDLGDKNISKLTILNSIFISFIFILFYFKKNKNLSYTVYFSEFHITIKQFINSKFQTGSVFVFLLSCIFLFLTFLAFSILFNSQFTEAVRSPWKMIPAEFFYIYFINTFILINIILNNKFGRISLIFVCLHYFLTLSIALIVYKIGYGYDPFIHRATEEVIYLKGQITPKPFYYLGQYAIIIYLAKILYINIISLDKIFLALFTSIFLPISIYTAFSALPKISKKYASLISLCALVIPLQTFIATTPQGLANTFVLITISLSLIIVLFFIPGAKKKIPLWSLWIPAISTVLIHPLAGIPLILFVLILSVIYLFKNSTGFFKFSKYIILFLISLFSAIALPLVFIINAKLSGQNLDKIITYEKISGLLVFINNLSPSPFYAVNRFNFIKDIIYFYNNNIYFIFILISLLTIYLFYKKNLLKYFSVYYLFFIIILINFALIKTFILFSALINYEQSDYANRVFNISFYFLLPFLFFLIYYIFLQLKNKHNISLNIFCILLLTSVISSSMYFAYPREDGYTFDRGYNVANSDIVAVHHIDEDAKKSKTKDYIVLANQTVSAAALQEFGFKKYYVLPDKTQIFYYPIPTSSPLYDFYLDMVYEQPNREKVKEAADFTGVKTVYFVVNKYWARAREIISESKKQANEWVALDEDKIFVFKYEF